jgi:hypothetical protein
MKHALRALALLASSAVSFAATARAADLPCGPAEPGTVQLDGLTDDWADVPGVVVGGNDANLSFTVKCNVEPQKLLLLVDVRDNYFVRTRQARPGEDHIALTLAGHTLSIYPGDARAIPTQTRWGKRPAKKISAVSALQEHGWAVELALPFSSLPGYKAGMPLSYRAQVSDCDSKAKLTTERTLADGGRVVFAEVAGALDGFLKDRGLAKRDIWFDRGLSLGGNKGARVVLASRDLAVITDGYVYVELPFATRADVKDVRVVDLAGDRRQAVALRYLERGGGGAREVLAIFRPAGDELRRVFAAEVGKTTPAGHVEDKVTFVRRGRATDIVIAAGAAAGLSAATWHETPADDMIPILLPWSADRRARYQFSGDIYQRAQ